jgi:hypothetical protein
MLSACNFTPKETEDRNVAVQTSAAQTIEANNTQLTMTAQQALLTSQAQTLAAPMAQLPEQTEPPVQTEPPLVQTEAPPVQTEAPPVQTEPPPPLPPPLPKISANVETNCRTGPSPQYPAVSYLLVGQQSVVLGANPEHTWWLIEDPKKPGTKCWVWGSTTRVEGDIAAAPVVEPPPPANVLPSFQAEYTNMHICGGVAMAVFWVGVDSPVTFRFSSILIMDVSTNLGIAGPEPSNTPFMNNPGDCPPGRDSLGMGGAGYIAKGIGAVPPSGTKARAIIILCTEPNQSGQCVEKKVNFVFP